MSTSFNHWSRLKVGKYALIYLPVHGRHMQLRIIPGFRGIDISLIYVLFDYFRKPDGVVPHYMAGQHYWKIGMRGFRLRDVTGRLPKYFKVLSAYRNRDWVSSYNFVLESNRDVK